MTKVALMCGHGRSTDGTWDCGTSYGGNNEAALMLSITKAAVKYLRSYGVEVISDADTNNNKNMIADVSWANKEKVSIYVSLHCDWYKAPTGTLPLYVSAKGRTLAAAINKAVMSGVGMKTRGVTKRTDLYELNYTNMPACIFETGSIKADISKLKNDPDKYGKCIAKGICDYLGVKAEAPTVSAPTTPTVSDGKLKVDGDGGKATVKRMQEFFGTEQDGVISGQNAELKKYYPSLTAVKFGTVGSACVRRLQKWLGLEQTGIIDKATVQAWQTKLGVESDGYFGKGSMKKWQTYLNEHDKAEYPVVKTKPQLAVEYGEALAKDNSYHYVSYNTKDEKTKECPICRKFPNGKYKGFNCIRFVFSCWFHADISCKHEGGLINNAIGDRMYSASEAQMLKLAQDAIGCKDITVMRNKNGFSDSQLKVGDACMHFEKGVYKHIYLYAGNGMMVDSGNWSDTAKQIAVRKRQSCQIIIRYTGK